MPRFHVSIQTYMKAEEDKEKAVSRCKGLMRLVIDQPRRRYGAMKNARRILAGCYILILVFAFFFLGGCGPGYYRGRNRGYIRVDNRGDRHYYRDGRWYKHDSRGNEIAVDVLAIGALIESLPPQHTTVVVQGAPYYHDDKYYYRQHPNGGYMVVPAPAIVQPQPKSDHNDRGDRGGNSNSEGNRGENH